MVRWFSSDAFWVNHWFCFLNCIDLFNRHVWCWWLLGYTTFAQFIKPSTCWQFPIRWTATEGISWARWIIIWTQPWWMALQKREETGCVEIRKVLKVKCYNTQFKIARLVLFRMSRNPADFTYFELILRINLTIHI